MVGGWDEYARFAVLDRRCGELLGSDLYLLLFGRSESFLWLLCRRWCVSHQLISESVHLAVHHAERVWHEYASDDDGVLVPEWIDGFLYLVLRECVDDESLR